MTFRKRKQGSYVTFRKRKQGSYVTFRKRKQREVMENQKKRRKVPTLGMTRKKLVVKKRRNRTI